MPYKVSGKTVYKKENNKWVILKRHESKEKALKHFKALKANVKDA